MAFSNTVYVGIRGSVIALDRGTGVQIWSSHLKGSDFVNVTIGDGELYAATRGELFCLDDATGQIRWHNPLKGLGMGLLTIAVRGAQPGQNVVTQKRRRDEQAAAATAASAG